MSQATPDVMRLLERLNRVAERLERAGDRAIARRDQHQHDHDHLAQANEDLMATRQAIAVEIDGVITRLRSLLGEE